MTKLMEPLDLPLSRSERGYSSYGFPVPVSSAWGSLRGNLFAKEISGLN